MVSNLFSYIFVITCLAIQSLLLMSKFYYAAPFFPLALGALLVFWKWPEISFLLFVFVIPFEGLFAGHSIFTGAKILGGLLLCIVLLRVFTRQISLQQLRSPLVYPLFVFVFFSVLSCIFSDYPGQIPAYIRQLLTALAVCFITLGIGNRINLLHLSRSIVVSISITAAIALSMTTTIADGRAVGFLTDPNYFALLLLCAIPLAIYLIIHDRPRWYRIGWILLLIVLLSAFQKTMSRSGSLVLMAILFFLACNYAYLLKRLSLSQLCLGVMGILLTTVITVVLLPDEYRERILSLSSITEGVHSVEDRSLSRRSSYIIVGLENFKKNPVFGTGPGTFTLKYAESGYSTSYVLSESHPDIFRRAHNTYLELLTENGLTGLLSLLIVILVGLNQYRKARRYALERGNRQQADLITHYGLAFASVVLFFLFLSVLTNKYFWIYLAIGGSLPWVTTESRKGLR